MNELFNTNNCCNGVVVGIREPLCDTGSGKSCSRSKSDNSRRRTTRAAEPVEERAVATLASKQNAFDMFQEGRTVEEVMSATNRAKATVAEYLVEFIEQTQLSDPTPWVDLPTFDRIRAACRLSPDGRLKPIFEALEGTVTYDVIRIAVACLRNLPPDEYVATTNEEFES